MWFKHDTSKNTINSIEYDDCIKRIIKLNTELELFKASVEAHKLQLDTLRGVISRKLKGIQQEEQKGEEHKTETINNSEFVAFG